MKFNDQLKLLVTTILLIFSGVLISSQMSSTDFKISPYLFGDFSSKLGIQYHINHINLIFSLIIFIVLLCYFINYFILNRNNQLFSSSYLGKILIYFGSSFGIFINNDLFHLYVLFEVNAIVSYILITNNKSYQGYLQSFNYLIFGSIATGLMLIGIALMYAKIGQLNITLISQYIANTSTVPSSIKYGIIIFIIGTLMKSAFWPFSKWMIRIYYYAPIDVAGLLLAVSNKLGIFILAKFIIELINPKAFTEFIFGLQILAIYTLVISYLRAWRTKNLKLFTIYTSFAQIALIIFCLTLKEQEFKSLAIILVITHVFEKFSLFLIFDYSKTSINYSLTSFFKYKSCFVLGIILFLSLSAISFPLTLGFPLKWYLLKLSFAKSLSLFIFILVMSVLSLSCYLKIIAESFLAMLEPGKYSKPVQYTIPAAACFANLVFAVYFDRFWHYLNLANS